jgi:hypothetical protein
MTEVERAFAANKRAEAERLENKGLADEYRKLVKAAMDVTQERDRLKAEVERLRLGFRKMGIDPGVDESSMNANIEEYLDDISYT